MALKKGSQWSNWSWDKPVKAFIWRSSRICRPIGGLPPGFFEDSLPHLLLRNNSIVAERQKHNGMSWSKDGSVALASVTALKKNKEYKKWFQEAIPSPNSEKGQKLGLG
jgi:hypothetical protein